jgi:malic enzyme
MEIAAVQAIAELAQAEQSDVVGEYLPSPSPADRRRCRFGKSPST